MWMLRSVVPAALPLVLVMSLAPVAAHAQIAPVTPDTAPPPSSGQNEPPVPIAPPRYRPAPPPPPPRERPAMGRDAPAAHMFELTMGFLAGQRSYSDVSFNNTNGVAAQLSAPFSAAPYNGTTVLGLRYDVRMIVTYLRMTAGVDLPFSTFRSADTTNTYMVDGKPATVTVQSLRPYELRFGIGGEFPVSIFAPFVDFIGAVHWVETSLAVGDMKADFEAQTFGFSIRGGCRAQMNRWFFVQLAGEAGIYGPVRWNADLSVGFSAGGHRW